MTIDQAGIESDLSPASSEEPRQRIGVPDLVMIDGLRQQVSTLNDQLVRANIELDFANQVIVSLQHTLEHLQAGTDPTHVHEEFDQ